MRLSGLALLVTVVAGVALAGPPEVLVVVDCSGSMQEQVPIGNPQKKLDIPGGTVVFKGKPAEKTEPRIESAKRALIAMIDQIPAGTKLGVRLFAHRSGGRSDEQKRKSCQDTELIFPIAAPDRPAMKARVAAIGCKGWTPLAFSLEQAGKDFADTADVERTVVVLSDGQETCGGDPVAVARSLRASGLKIVTDVIGFAVDAQTRAQLEQVAHAGGGKYYSADDASALARSLAQAVKATVASPPPPPPTPTPSAPDPKPSVAEAPAEKVVFADEFDGDKLASGWERRDPDDERFVIEGGKVVVIVRRLSKIEGQWGWYNTLAYTKAPPENFEATLDFEAEPSKAQLIEFKAVQGERFVSTRLEWNTNYPNQSAFIVTKGTAKEPSAVRHQSSGVWAGEMKQEGRARGLLGLRKVGREWQGYLRVGEQEVRLDQKVLGLKPTELQVLVGHSRDDSYPEKEVHLHKFQIKELK